MRKYSTLMSHHLCDTYQVELPEEKLASNMGKNTNALPPARHLPSRIARSEGCLDWQSTLMPCLLCGTYQVELPEVKVASNREVHYNALPPLWHLPNRIARGEGCLE
jgi:hypothetical protein